MPRTCPAAVAEQVQAAQSSAIAHLDTSVCCHAGTHDRDRHRSRWDEAMDEIEWEAAEVLVVGSSRVGQLARVFLGSAAIKIVRYSPVPVLVVPAAVAADWPRRSRRSHRSTEQIPMPA